MNEQEYKIKGWVARDEDDILCFFNKKPTRIIECNGWYIEDGCETAIVLDNGFPELTWEDEPIEVELTIKKI